MRTVSGIPFALRSARVEGELGCLNLPPIEWALFAAAMHTSDPPTFQPSDSNIQARRIRALGQMLCISGMLDRSDIH